MTGTLLLFLPVAACIFCIAQHVMMASRTETFWSFTSLLLFSGIFLLTSCLYTNPDPQPDTLILLTLCAQFAAPCIIPLGIIYLRQLRMGPAIRHIDYLWLIFPIALLTAGSVIISIVGQETAGTFLWLIFREGEDIARSYKGEVLYKLYIWNVVVFRAILGFQMLVLLISLFIIAHNEKFLVRDLFRFLFKGKRIRIIALQCLQFFLCILVFAPLFFRLRIDHSSGGILNWTLSILAAVLIYFLSYFALMGARRTISLKEMKDALRYNFYRGEEEKVLEGFFNNMVENADKDALVHLQESLDKKLDNTERHIPLEEEEKTLGDELLKDNEAETEDEHDLLPRFRHIMRENKLFLQANLTLGDVAEELHSNKTYISKLVNNTYNMGFPELVNTLRIDYAEQYILEHREAKQDEIATACGFTSASSFNNMFKKMTGMTPKEWERHATTRAYRKHLQATNSNVTNSK